MTPRTAVPRRLPLSRARWLFLGALLLTALLTPSALTRATPPAQAMGMAARIECTRAIEEVQWQARLWPEVNPGPKPPLDVVMPSAAIEAKARAAVAQSAALDALWAQPITPAMLQREIDRMAANSKEPARLAALWAALGNDPQRIAECLARPVLAERLLRAAFEADERAAGERFERWWATVEPTLTLELAPEAHAYTLPTIRPAGGDDTWEDTPSIPGSQGVGVWSGTEMLYLGQFAGEGYRYDLATDTWQTMTTVNAPFRVSNFSAVWSGTEFIMWGGCNGGSEFCSTSAGSRYNPATDTWVATTFAGAPRGRRFHGAVWTGSEMLIWGGCHENSNGNQNCSTVRNDGGRYNPVTDSWQPITTAGAPAGRRSPSMVWTDDEMIVWNGSSLPGPGGRYNPTTDTWQPISTANAPAPEGPTLVWTGDVVVAWGGCTIATTGMCNVPSSEGGRYDPETDTWNPTSAVGAPSPRYEHGALWTGSEMVLWGGTGGITTFFNDGRRYDPVSDTWSGMSMVGAPAGRARPTVLWTGSEVLIWGGGSTIVNRDGARYSPASDSWTPISINDPYSRRHLHEAIWTGTEMIAWGGLGDGTAATGLQTGRRYDPATDSWSATSLTNAPWSRRAHTLIWTGSEMIAWGGNTQSWSQPGDGGRYNPMTDSWTPTSESGAPEAPSDHVAVWTGSEMMVWGGALYSGYANGGGRYNPVTDSWTPLSTTGAPAGRTFASGVWTGSEMIVWGGSSPSGISNVGALYNPSTNSWRPMTNTNAPERRTIHATVWTGSEMIVWGGVSQYSPWTVLNTGGRYNPTTDTWTATSMTNAPPSAARLKGVWTGQEMIVWSGCYTGSSCLDDRYTGGRYNPATDSWTATSMVNVPERRQFYTAVWTGTAMIVWAGEAQVSGDTNTGALYYAATGPNGAPTAGNDQYAGVGGTTLTVAVPGLLANDSDPEGATLSAHLLTTPAHGTVTLQPNGSLSYVPTAGYSGADSFTYRAFDGLNYSAPATVSLTITAGATPTPIIPTPPPTQPSTIFLPLVRR